MGSEKEEAAPKVAVIAKPMADSKLTKKIYKLIKRGELHARVNEGDECCRWEAMADGTTSRTRWWNHTQLPRQSK